jgi:hypothetical protein
MSSSLSTQFLPSLLPLPTVTAWQDAGGTLKQRATAHIHDLRTAWDNALQFRREATVETFGEGAAAPQAIVAVDQRKTGVWAHEAVMVKHRARQVLTAIRTLDDQMRLFSWRVNADGAVICTGSSAPVEAIQQVQLVRARSYVVGCRTQSGELHLSRWDVSNTGAIYLAGEKQPYAHQIQWVEMAALSADVVATFVLTQASTWQLLLWQLQGDNDLMLLHSHELPAAPVNSCGLAVLPPSGDSLQLATVVAETPTTLALHLWQCRPGEALTLASTLRIASPPIVAIIATHVTDDRVSVIVQTATGQIRLLVCRLDKETQRSFYQQTIILEEGVSQFVYQKQADGFILVCRTMAGQVQVQRWRQADDGSFALAGVGSQPESISGEVLCADEPLEGNAPLLTGIIDAHGELTLTTWTGASIFPSR